MIGRSQSFWKHYYRDLQRLFPQQLDLVDANMFYHAINRIEPSLIRTEADEVTYNLHVSIRYEIEKMLFNDNLSIDELPHVWNEKYKSYLGIRPSHASEGVLQDVHWSSGSFGYFPSYSLGNMYAAQIMDKMHSELPQLDELISNGQLKPIKQWLTKQVYQYGKLLTPAEIIKKVTGKALRPQYLVDYLTKKMREVYEY